MFKRLPLQLLAYAAFCVPLGVFSTAPRYSELDPSLALLRVSFSHAGERREPCRRYTPEEIAQMAPNMRRELDCARERVPLVLEVDVDGSQVLDLELPPSGLAKDGASTVYARVPIAPGSHQLGVRMRDTRRESGFDHEREFELELAPGQSQVLDFTPGSVGFQLL